MSIDDANARTIAASAVRDVIHRLALASDLGTVEEWFGLMTDDVVIDVFGNVTEGRESAMAGAVERRGKGTTGPDSKTRHLVTTVVVDVIDDDSANSSATVLFVGLDPKVEPRLVVTYQDTFCRIGDAWKLARRVAR